MGLAAPRLEQTPQTCPQEEAQAESFRLLPSGSFGDAEGWTVVPFAIDGSLARQRVFR